jgi:subtilisin family serine protease
MRWSHEPYAQTLLSAPSTFGSGPVEVGFENPSQVAAIARSYNVRVVHEDPSLHALTVNGSPSALAGLQRAVSLDPRLRYVEPVARLQYLHLRSDPLTYLSDPSTGRPYEWNFDAVHLDRALNLSKGDANILVGIVDTGFAQVPDVAGKYARAHYFGDEATTPYDDTVGHGTFNASLIAANNDDGKGLAGFCGACRLDVFRVVNLYDYKVATAIRLLADDGVRVINLSLGSPEYSYVEADAINYAISKGVLVVAAAGNDGTGAVSYPAAFLQPSGGGPSYGLAVGASDSNGNRASYSNWGDNLSLLAPATFTGRPSGVIGALPPYSVAMDNGYHEFSDSTTNARYTYNEGTSFAAPEVAGIAALVWAARPDLANWQVATIVKQSAGGPWSPDRGWGVVDAAKALELATGKSSADTVQLSSPVISGKAVSGSSLAVTSQATWQDGTTITQGNVVCSATLGSRTLPSPTGQLDNTGAASCLLQVPPRSTGMTVQGTIQVTDVDGNVANADFTEKVSDVQPPTVAPIRSEGRYGHSVPLHYTLSDDSGRARLRIDIRKRGVRVATITRPLSAVRAGYAYTQTWKAPRAPKKPVNWTFCATATDATGNTGPRRCAPLYLR